MKTEVRGKFQILLVRQEIIHSGFNTQFHLQWCSSNISSGFKEVTGVASHPLKGLKKLRLFEK